MNQDARTDEDLMFAYASGNETAFLDLYRRYESRIYGFLFNRLSAKQRHLSSDLFQKTWLRVHANRRSFDPTRKFSSWIFTIALNALRDHLALKSERAEIVFLEDSLETASGHNQELKFLEEELKQNIRAAIEQLPPTQKEAVLLSEIEGFSSAEVANIMHLSDGAVRQLLFRARNTIRQKWRKK